MRFTLKEFDKVRPLLKDDVVVDLIVNDCVITKCEDDMHEITIKLLDELNIVLDMYSSVARIPRIEDGASILLSKTNYLHLSKDVFTFDDLAIIAVAYERAYGLSKSEDLQTIYERFVDCFK